MAPKAGLAPLWPHGNFQQKQPIVLDDMAHNQ